MSIFSAMYAGVSGLDAESSALGVIGNNLSNSSTVGFKESREEFDTVLGAAAGTEGAVGGGVQMTSAQQIFSEGSLVNTGLPTDVALSGDGFFVVNGSVGGMSGNFYTRDGQTSLNSNGTLVNPDGLAFEGYAANPDGTFSTTLAPIQVSTSALAPKPTTTVNITANLNSADTPPPALATQPTPPVTPPVTWDPQNPGTSSNFSTSMQVYDSLGNAHTVNVYFANQGNGSWTYHVLAPGSDVAAGTAGQNSEIATGTLTFNSSGALQSNTVTAGGTVSFNGATANQPLAFNFGSPIAGGGTGLNGVTQYGSPDTISTQSQDGYASGSLTGVTIDANGTVEGSYTNGQTLAVAQMGIAKFPSNTGLGQMGQNLWNATPDSGIPAVGTAGTGGRGSLVAGSLEGSNVDMSAQFVDLIAQQSGFQADSKTITTADQMLQTLMQLTQ
jgi:flagellar hook protein FlgE